MSRRESAVLGLVNEEIMAIHPFSSSHFLDCFCTHFNPTITLIIHPFTNFGFMVRP